MKVRDFINAYQPNEVSAYNVWSFIVDCYYVYDDPFEFEEKVLDLELDYFQIENAVDISYEDCYGKNGVNVFAKTKVFIYTTEYKMLQKRRS